MDNTIKSMNEKIVSEKTYKKIVVREYEPGLSSANNYGNTNIKPMTKEQMNGYYEHMKELTGRDWGAYSSHSWPTQTKNSV